jgi:hypothetical protein
MNRELAAEQARSSKHTRYNAAAIMRAVSNGARRRARLCQYRTLCEHGHLRALRRFVHIRVGRTHGTWALDRRRY